MHGPAEDSGERSENESLGIRRFLTVRDAAEFASLSEKTIRRLASAGRLIVYRPCAGRILIDRLQLESLILASRDWSRAERSGKEDAK